MVFLVFESRHFATFILQRKRAKFLGVTRRSCFGQLSRTVFVLHIDSFHPFHWQQGLHSTEVRFLCPIKLLRSSLLTDSIPYSSPGLRLADKRSLPCPNRATWLAARDQLYEDIMEKSWNHEGKFFGQSYEDNDVLDSAVLIMPLVFFMHAVAYFFGWMHGLSTLADLFCFFFCFFFVFCLPTFLVRSQVREHS